MSSFFATRRPTLAINVTAILQKYNLTHLGNQSPVSTWAGFMSKTSGCSQDHTIDSESLLMYRYEIRLNVYNFDNLAEYEKLIHVCNFVVLLEHLLQRVPPYNGDLPTTGTSLRVPPYNGYLHTTGTSLQRVPPCNGKRTHLLASLHNNFLF